MRCRLSSFLLTNLPYLTGQPVIASAIRALSERLILRINFRRVIHATQPALIHNTLHSPVRGRAVHRPMVFLAIHTGSRGPDFGSVGALIYSVRAIARMASYVVRLRSGTAFS